MNVRRAAWVLIVWALAAFASAHDLALSGIRLIVRGSDTVVSVAVHRSKLQKAERATQPLSSLDADLAVRRRLRLTLNGKPFVPGKSHLIDDPASDLFTWQATFPEPASTFQLAARLFPEEDASKTLVTLTKNGAVAEEVLLDARHPNTSSGDEAAPPLETAKRFLVQGVEHILSGADHVLFVLGLILLGGGLKSLLKIVTAFTVAHSVTLSLAATGVFNPPSRIVEPLIALSIVAIAVENLRPKPEEASGPRDFRPWVAFLFGLVHGFGFAGAMSEVGLQGPALAGALVTFNVGVELGQASIIAVAAPVFGWIAIRKPLVWERLALAGSIAIGLAGAYWFASRIAGG